MAFAVQRRHGKNEKIYLHAWCKEWGTSWMLSTKSALKFATKEEAEAAAARAQAACKDVFDVGFTFTAVAI